MKNGYNGYTAMITRAKSDENPSAKLLNEKFCSWTTEKNKNGK